MKLRRFLLIVTLVMSILVLSSCVREPEHRTYDINESFSGIRVEVDTAEVKIVPTSGEARVVCEGDFTVEVKDGELKITEINDHTNWLKRIFTKSEYEVTVYLPNSEYEYISIYCSVGEVDIEEINAKTITAMMETGDIELSGITSETVKILNETGVIDVENCKSDKFEVTNDTGMVELSRIECSSLKAINDTGRIDITGAKAEDAYIEVETGDIKLEDVIISGKLTITADTGDISFTLCDGGEVYITSNTGDVKGSFLTDKIIFAESDTGRIDVPHLTSGGKCEITTDTGDIIITIGE